MRKNILIADDDENMNKLLSVILKSDYEVTTTESVRDAKKAFINNKFEAVILDLNMPEVSGLELLDYIRQEMGEKWLPVIVLSGKEKSEDRIECFNHHADDYLIKPFNPEELKLRLKRLVERFQFLKKSS